MITAVGHADLTPATWELVRTGLRAHLRGLPPDTPALVRAGAGLQLAFGRVAHELGRRLVVLLPEHGDAPPGGNEGALRAHRELRALAAQIRLLPLDPLDRDACVSADERLVAGCSRLLAVWDGSPSSGQDATAHMVAYARARGIAVDVVWPAGAARERPRNAAPVRVP
ncbi:hypothetical protein [Streptomyces sp. 8L]|uniref:hypothetical protein n=1 Tax=Streptomyces sp. 8L TaxID=2877242 RepID=UPI001CD1AC83|nr:hypothetical protein [Streptomyces sp. 8L]MCA1223013.1 hypothetical protein [Streptomyces sp. 8L]